MFTYKNRLKSTQERFSPSKRGLNGNMEKAVNAKKSSKFNLGKTLTSRIRVNSTQERGSVTKEGQTFTNCLSSLPINIESQHRKEVHFQIEVESQQTKDVHFQKEGKT